MGFGATNDSQDTYSETNKGCNPPCPAGYRCVGAGGANGECLPANADPNGPFGTGPPPPQQGQCGPVPGTNPPVPRKWDASRSRCVPNCGGGQGYDGKIKKCRGCGPGETMSEQGRCLPGLNGGGGGGGGTGGGGGGGASPFGNSMSLLGLGGGQASEIWQQLHDVLQGKGLPFSPETIAGLEGQAAGARESSIARAQAGVNEGAIDRGMFGSGATQQSLLDARMQGEQQFGTNLTQIRTTAAMQNFQAKMGALDKAQKWLDSLRDYASRLDQTQASREAAAAGIALGYAQIQFQRDSLQQQMALNWAQFDFSKQQNTICIGGTCMPWNQFYGTYGG